MIKKTKIIATVWPATWEEDKIIALYKNWVNCLRFNFSHADYENAARVADIVHRLNQEEKVKLSLMLDTKWPEIRTGDYEWVKAYQKWDIFKIFVDKNIPLGEQDLFCDYPFLLEDINIWDFIKIESWLFDVLVKEKHLDHVLVEAISWISIKQRRHINLPGIKLKLPGLIEQDKKDVLFAIQQGFDYIAMSFVRNKENIQELRNLLKENNAQNIQIISKIENQEAMDNYKQIVQFSDWVMVARWDLWIEVPIQDLPVYQQQIVDECRKQWKFVIVATHMLETMIENPFPTRAEVSDIYNAVMQRVDAIMLSWETTIWKYPLQAVEMMKSVAMKAESSINYDHEDFEYQDASFHDVEKKYLIKAAIDIAEKNNISSIAIFTKTWKLAKLAAAFRPNVKIYAFTNSQKTVTNTTLLFGVISRYIDFEDHSEVLDTTIRSMIEKKDVSNQEKLIVITDIRKDWKEIPVLEIIDLADFY